MIFPSQLGHMSRSRHNLEITHVDVSLMSHDNTAHAMFADDDGMPHRRQMAMHNAVIQADLFTALLRL